MLIEFRVSNFRSFRDTQVLSMVAGTGSEHRETHTFATHIPDAKRLLASAALYGPNAAGKTNLLKALQCMQAIVVNSSIVSPATPVPYTPFQFDMLTQSAPTEFEIAFIEDGTRYEYQFSFDASRILSEHLIEFSTKKPRQLFRRTFDSKRDDYDWHFSTAFRGNRSVWRSATRPNGLFLSTAVQLNSVQLLPVFSWLQKRMVPIIGPSNLNLLLTLQLLEQPGGKEQLLPFIREADFGIEDVQVTAEPFVPQLVLGQQTIPGIVYQEGPNLVPKVARVRFSHAIKDTDSGVDLDIGDESGGTQMLFRTGGAWLNVLRNGEILLIDELDTSLHPLLVRFLINLFHSKATNHQQAQIIFTTHNTSILNTDIFRRDQIWFVEKTNENASKLYPLSDFSPRKDEVIERWYLRGRYGALPILSDLKP
jgi:AAA15 family ATPase/GTPase